MTIPAILLCVAIYALVGFLFTAVQFVRLHLEGEALVTDEDLREAAFWFAVGVALWPLYLAIVLLFHFWKGDRP